MFYKGVCVHWSLVVFVLLLAVILCWVDVVLIPGCYTEKAQYTWHGQGTQNTGNTWIPGCCWAYSAFSVQHTQICSQDAQQPGDTAHVQYQRPKEPASGGEGVLLL